MIHFSAVFIVLISKYIISLRQHFHNYNNTSFSYPLTTRMPQMEPQEKDLLNPIELKDRPCGVESVGVIEVTAKSKVSFMQELKLLQRFFHFVFLSPSNNKAI